MSLVQHTTSTIMIQENCHDYCSVTKKAPTDSVPYKLTKQWCWLSLTAFSFIYERVPTFAVCTGASPVSICNSPPNSRGLLLSWKLPAPEKSPKQCSCNQPDIWIVHGAFHMPDNDGRPGLRLIFWSNIRGETTTIICSTISAHSNQHNILKCPMPSWEAWWVLIWITFDQI